METDEEVYLRYVKEDNDTDLETLLIRHRDGLMLFLLGFVRNTEDAEDLMMDTFAKLALDKPDFEPERTGSFKSWLYTIARRNALMHIRKRKYETVPLEEDIPSDTDLPDVALLREESKRKLYQAMSALKPEYRRVLYLRYLENLPHEEIAVIMKLNIRQVYHLVERGKASLKKMLERMGITDAQY